jgi:hypothetical protein
MAMRPITGGVKARPLSMEIPFCPDTGRFNEQTRTNQSINQTNKQSIDQKKWRKRKQKRGAGK